jgi:hypothetical protein
MRSSLGSLGSPPPPLGVVVSAAGVVWAGDAVDGEPVDALEALDRSAGAGAVDAVGLHAELLLQRADGVGALHARRHRAGGVLGERAAGGHHRQPDGERDPGPAAQGQAPAPGLGGPPGARGSQRAPPRYGRAEIALRCHVDFNPPVVSSPTGLAVGLAL